MSDVQEIAVEEPTKKFLRSQNIWKIGEKFPVSYAPTVEGMVVSTRWIENILMVLFLSPAYAKPEGTWAEASVMYKTAASLVRKQLPSYEYPFPSDPRILEEVQKAKGNLEMLQEVVKFLNKPRSIQQRPQLSRSAWDSDEIALPPPDEPNEENGFMNFHSSQRDNVEVSTSTVSDKMIEKIVQEVSLRLNINSKKKHKNKKAKKAAKESKNKVSSDSSSSASSSSDSDSSSSSDEEKVRCVENDEGSGWFQCPFSPEDARHSADPRKKMEGKLEERRMLRQALHNIYSDHSTLKVYVDTIRTDSTSSATRPYNSDLIWLTCHATYIDLLLLHATTGPWSSWNELVLDNLTRTFLELLVRSSSNRVYPDILDEKVRKWMKRKRVGLSGQFGAIPSFLVGAKITESGIHPKGGWEFRGSKENTNSNRSLPSSTSSFRPKPPSSPPNDKKL